MRQQGYGRIINISSISREGNIGQAIMRTKAGVVGLTKTAAKEVGSFGITCNAICPGFMDTDMTKTIPDKVKEKMVGAIPVGRMERQKIFCERSSSKHQNTHLILQVKY